MPLIPESLSLAGVLARLRSFVRAARNGGALDADMREEFRVHVEMRSEDLQRRGHSPDEAYRMARAEFGHLESHRREGRLARGLRVLDEARFSWLDVKLGMRMLLKHPVLSVAAVFALAVGIPVGLAPAHVARALAAPLPGDTENRVRAIRLWDPFSSSVAATTAADYEEWSRSLDSFTQLAAFRSATYNVAAAGGQAAPVAGAELSASTFAILRAAPMLGRAFVSADGEAGAPAVVVIGHSLWTARFGSDRSIISRTIRIGSVLHTVVGVMPEGFRFPSNEQLWLPMPSAPGAGEGARRSVRIVGRLADNVTPNQAQAELDATTRLGRVEQEPSRARLVPEVVPFGFQYMGLPRGGLDALPEYRFVQMLMLALLLVACGNVAMLVYARTATRAREMAMRTALGASRARIVTQIFVETIVLSTVAAASGVVAIDWLLRHVNLAVLAGESALPYWLSLGVTSTTMMQAIALAVVSATLAGVAPAVRITGRWVQQTLRNGARTRFGGWVGALVVADIAVAVAAVGLALSIGRHANAMLANDRSAGVAAGEYLAVEFRLPDAPNPSGDDAVDARLANRRASAQHALVEALEREPGVRGVAVGDVLPRMEHRSTPIEIEGVERPADAPARWVRTARVDPRFVEGLGQQVVAGRDFTTTDAQEGRAVALVNEAFAERLLEGGDPIGRRIRFATSSTPSDTAWREIVGVVAHLGVNMMNPEHGEAVYLPAAPGTLTTLQVAIRTAGTPAQFAPRVREVAAGVDPELVMGRAIPLADVRQGDWYLMIAIAGGLALLVGILVALAATGLYAMLSLSVTERTREIGIRAALGGRRWTLVLTILRRSLLQIGVGALVGTPFAFRFAYELAGDGDADASASGAIALTLAIAAGIVVAIATCACLVPTRRVLAIDATEAMKGQA